MSEVRKVEVTAYYAPTRGRRYFTLRAACLAEARSVIEKKYPTEPFENDTGYSFYWREIPRADVMYRRLARLIHSMYLKTNEIKNKRIK